MPCYHPIKAWQDSEGGKLKFGKSPPGDKMYSPIRIPCGRCLGCRLQYSQMWGTRMIHEGKMHKENCFITLTYNEENLPYDQSLIKTQFPKFIRALRQKLNKKIRYYHCGEYGENLGRPHYHAILFGHDWHDKELIIETDSGKLYESKLLEKIWGKGYCTTAELTIDSAQYVSRYILKKINGDKKDDHYRKICAITGEIHNLQQEFATMSRSPGIGHTFWQKYRREIINNDSVVHMSKGKPKFAKVPKYYDTQLEKEDIQEYTRIKEARQKFAMDHIRDSTLRRLTTREYCKARQIIDVPRNKI